MSNAIAPVSRMATPCKGLPLTHISPVLKMGARTCSFSPPLVWAGSWLSLLASIALAAGSTKESNGVGSAPPTENSPRGPTYSAGGYCLSCEFGGVHRMGLVVIPGRCASARVSTFCNSACNWATPLDVVAQLGSAAVESAAALPGPATR
jgi:hypothetical protein